MSECSVIRRNPKKKNVDYFDAFGSLAEPLRVIPYNCFRVWPVCRWCVGGVLIDGF